MIKVFTGKKKKNAGGICRSPHLNTGGAYAFRPCGPAGGLMYLTLLLLVLISAHSCYYDSEEYLFPSTADQCDSVNITYSGSIIPVLQNNCLSCHSNSTAPAFGGNIRLENYADVKARADDLRLYGSIAHQQGYAPMPQGGTKLSDCIISAFRIWIGAGAPDN